MLRTGIPALLVAVLGVATPLLLGTGVSLWIQPEQSLYGHLFLGATLTATSVGITARVLSDLGRSNSTEARIILGAAVIDDVLGLIVLAVVGSMIRAGSASASIPTVAATIGKASMFLLAALSIGTWLSPRLMRVMLRLRGRDVLLAISLCACLLLSALAGLVGLAPIVGAYAAGLIFEDGERRLRSLIRPIVSVLAPVFFVRMGFEVDLRAFGELHTLALAGALIVAAILGKQACALGVLGAKDIDRRVIGIGMVPRGEVGLIFANVGLGLSLAGRPVLSASAYSAVVLMVIVTTLVTPPALKWSLSRGSA
jgi:Kef-type K+ transport system membrane component KefB